MSKITLPISAATREQLVLYAELKLGLPIDKNEQINNIRAKIRQAVQGDEIEVDEALPAQQGQGKGAKGAGAAKAIDPEEEITIIIMETSEESRDNRVKVQLNGIPMLIERGKPQRIKRKYAEVLKEAVMDSYGTDENGKRLPYPNKVPRYPFQIVPEAPRL